MYKVYYFFKKRWVYHNCDTIENVLEFVLNKKIMSRRGKNANFEIKNVEHKSILRHFYSPTQDSLCGVTYDTSNKQIQCFLNNHFFK